MSRPRKPPAKSDFPLGSLRLTHLRRPEKERDAQGVSLQMVGAARRSSTQLDAARRSSTQLDAAQRSSTQLDAAPTTWRLPGKVEHELVKAALEEHNIPLAALGLHLVDAKDLASARRAGQKEEGGGVMGSNRWEEERRPKHHQNCQLVSFARTAQA